MKNSSFQNFSLDFLLNSGYNSFHQMKKFLTRREPINENIDAG
jgi:hypothetical protein